MANRYTTQFVNTLEKGVNIVYARISFAASGVPTLVSSLTVSSQNVGNSKGCYSITQNGTGDYSLVLQDTYVKLLGFSAAFDETSNSGTAPLCGNVWVKSQTVNTAAATGQGGTIRFVTGGYAAGAATNPASTEILMLTIHLSNSTAY